MRSEKVCNTGWIAVAIPLVVGVVTAACGSSPRGNWPVYGGDAGAMKYSALTTINRDNVAALELARVGQVVAKRARGFDMAVPYYNRSRLPADLEQGAVFHESLETLLPNCDFLSLNCPATPETRNLLNAGRIALLPDGAIVVNTARGAIVDDAALIAAFAAGKLAAAGLDVFNNEPDIDPGYRELANTFLLPHIGSATRETRDAMGFRACDNLDSFFAGGEPGDRVA